MTETASSVSQVKLKGIALPVQHGGWGFLLEPILLGFIVAPSIPALWLSLAALGVFLLHQPLKIVIKDYRKGKSYVRTTYARLFALIYAKLTIGALFLAYITSPHGFLAPLIGALPLGIFQFWQELNNQNREALAEIFGALAFGSAAAAIALIDGWALEDALILWLVLGIRAVPSILYVRARLRLERGNPISSWPALASHIAGLGLLLFIQNTPWLAVIAAGLLLARAIYGLSSYRKPVPAKIVGFQELAFGLAYVLLVGVGYG
jgi:hypothetical protein